MIRRVQQEHAWGCEIACAAMVLGVAYDDVVRDLTTEQCERLVRGDSPKFDLATYLRDRGCVVNALWPPKPVRLDPIWRPRPRTSLSVYATSTSADPSGLHAVVVLRDGTVIDPASPAPLPLEALYVWHVREIESGGVS